MMNMDRDASSTDEYFVTAVEIFDYCGAESSGTLRVDKLMEKFAPFIKTNKAEYSYLKSLLDPEQNNPEINVTKLAIALSQYSKSQKVKVDLDESFNLKTGPMDSDSGISSDGYQLLEDLQTELREKTHLAHQLRSQLDFTDRQHEEALGILTAERDSLRAHLNILREENMSLAHVRRDYEEVCDRLCGSDQALSDARRELDAARRKNKALLEQVSALDNEKQTLHELLTKSKDECHRINEMYLSRQAALREENETLKTDHADLAARLQDQEEFMQQIIKEKVLLEMELKDMLNKSNQTPMRLDRSIDVSYSEDQLTALDTLSADSRFTSENRILDEDSFASALKDQGGATNLSLFDEIRLSFSTVSRHSIFERDDSRYSDNLDTSLATIGIQKDEAFTDSPTDSEFEKIPSINIGIQTEEIVAQSYSKIKSDIGVQIEDVPQNHSKLNGDRCSHSGEIDAHNLSKINIDIGFQTEEIDILNNTQTKQVTSETQTDDYWIEMIDNNNCENCIKCLECANLNEYTTKLESDLKHSKMLNKKIEQDLEKYEANLMILQKVLDEESSRNEVLRSAVNDFQTKIGLLEAICDDQKQTIDRIFSDTGFAEYETNSDVASVSTQAALPCAECVNNTAAPARGLRRYLWEGLKCLFQVFAVVSFACAVCVLYGVTARGLACGRDAPRVPWRWLDAQEFMDLLLRIEYVADVPM